MNAVHLQGRWGTPCPPGPGRSVCWVGNGDNVLLIGSVGYSELFVVKEGELLGQRSTYTALLSAGRIWLCLGVGAR